MGGFYGGLKIIIIIIKRKWERKQILWVFGWTEERKKKLMKSRCFLSEPTKTLSPQFREKIKKKKVVAVKLLNYPSSHVLPFWLFFTFFFLFLYFLGFT